MGGLNEFLVGHDTGHDLVRKITLALAVKLDATMLTTQWEDGSGELVALPLFQETSGSPTICVLRTINHMQRGVSPCFRRLGTPTSDAPRALSAGAAYATSPLATGRLRHPSQAMRTSKPSFKLRFQGISIDVS